MQVLMYLSWGVFFCKIHLQVPVDELTLAQANHLHAVDKAQKLLFGVLLNTHKSESEHKMH